MVRRAGAFRWTCGESGRGSLACLLCELGDARDGVEDCRVHLWGREGRRRGERSSAVLSAVVSAFDTAFRTEVTIPVNVIPRPGGAPGPAIAASAAASKQLSGVASLG